GDAALADGVIAAFDAADGYSRALPDRPLTGTRLGVPLPAQRPWFGDFQAEHLYAQALSRLVGLGFTLHPIDFAPLFEAAAL
ncbi:hypothetical protein ABTK18_19795, partial [Acinetobacter baumannii]